MEDYECGLAPNPGRVTLRRLNAAEYRNTIRDLFGLPEFETASAFPGDDVGYGFDNIGDVLTLPPLLMEKYFLEAERISRVLIQTPAPSEVWEASYTGEQFAGPVRGSRCGSGVGPLGERLWHAERATSLGKTLPAYGICLRRPSWRRTVCNGYPGRRQAGSQGRCLK